MTRAFSLLVTLAFSLARMDGGPSNAEDWYPSKIGQARLEGAVQMIINPVAIR